MFEVLWVTTTRYIHEFLNSTSSPKMITRPTENQITISLYNLNYLSYNLLLVDTDTNGNELTDCTHNGI